MILYGSFGGSSMICIGHSLLLYGWDVQNDRMSLTNMGFMVATNFIGAAVYGTRVSMLVRSYVCGR